MTSNNLVIARDTVEKGGTPACCGEALKPRS
jgi:hypothetical protein